MREAVFALVPPGCRTRARGTYHDMVLRQAEFSGRDVEPLLQ